MDAAAGGQPYMVQVQHMEEASNMHVWARDSWISALQFFVRFPFSNE
jgi:hypothetical protein